VTAAKNRKDPRPRRNQKACERCAGKKVRCYGQTPSCEHCLRQGIECTYRSQDRLKRQRTANREAGTSTILAANQPMDSVKRDAFHDLAVSRSNTPTTHQLSSTDSWALLSCESADQAHPNRTEALINLAEPAATVAGIDCRPQADVPSSGHPDHTQYASQMTNGLDSLAYGMDPLIDYITKENCTFSGSPGIHSDGPTNIPLEPEDRWTDSLGSNTDYFDNKCNTPLFASEFAPYL